MITKTWEWSVFILGIIVITIGLLFDLKITLGFGIGCLIMSGILLYDRYTNPTPNKSGRHFV